MVTFDFRNCVVKNQERTQRFTPWRESWVYTKVRALMFSGRGLFFTFDVQKRTAIAAGGGRRDFRFAPTCKTTLFWVRFACSNGRFACSRPLHTQISFCMLKFRFASSNWHPAWVGGGACKTKIR